MHTRKQPARALPAPARRPAARTLAVLLAGVALASCTPFSVPPFPEPIRPPNPDLEQERIEGAATQEAAAAPAKYAPAPDVQITRTRAAGAVGSLGRNLQGPPIEAAFNGVPVVAFINEVFGTQLGMSFAISPGLQNKRDLVTLRLTQPVPPAQFFETARQVLQEYGVTIRERDGVLTFMATQEITGDEIPLFISGRTLPEVPATHRTVFQLVPLMVVRPNQIVGFVRDAFPRDDLSIDDKVEFNAVLLQGTPERVAQALDLIEVLDQPLLRGKHGMVVKPEFLVPSDLSEAMEEVLQAQGYHVNPRTGSLILLPFDELGKLVVFSQGQELLELAMDWVDRLDAADLVELDEGLFIYEVQNVQVVDMMDTLGQLVGVQLGGRRQADASRQAQGGASQPSGSGAAFGQTGSLAQGSRLVVDETRNLIIFRGAGGEWADILKVAKQLDRAIPSVLIEVLIAEVSLTNEEGSGFDFLFNSGLDRYGISGGTREALGLSSKGLSLRLDSAGQIRAVLNLFYKDDRVAIRSQPKLLVKSGEEASIDVGNEIPVVTQISDGSIQVGGSTNILQQVGYRSTGVSLSIIPLVQAGGLVDISINQQLSEAQLSAATSLSGTPTILNRALSTNLTLKDGSSLLMGGLISETSSSGQTGVPVLGRMPLLGRLFRNDAYQGDRTELMVMVTPYVVRDHSEGARLTEEIRGKLELHQRHIQD